jgi:hypothetical protein
MRRRVNLARLPQATRDAIEAHKQACFEDVKQYVRDMLMAGSKGAEQAVLHRIAAEKSPQAATEVEKVVRGIRANTVKASKFT